MLTIHQYKSENPGPSVGIFAITHGNEPVGLEVFERIEAHLEQQPLHKGTLTLVPINIAAFLHKDANGQPNPVRFLDADMNRIWRAGKTGAGAEFSRRDELYPLIESFDYALDIHSVSEGDFCAGITAPHLALEISKWCDAPYLLLGASDGAVIGPIIRSGGEGFGLEAGNHTSQKSGDRAWENVLRFLRYTGSISGSIPQSTTPQRVFKFISEIQVETSRFSFIEQFDEFHPVLPNAIYAIDGTNVLRNNSKSTVFTGIRSAYPTKGSSGGFLFEEQIADV